MENCVLFSILHYLFSQLKKTKFVGGFSHSQRERNFLLFSPLFLFFSSPFFVVFNYWLPFGFEWKKVQMSPIYDVFWHIEYYFCNKRNEKINKIVKRSGQNPGSFQKARRVKRKSGQIPVRAGENWKKPVGLKSFWQLTFLQLVRPWIWTKTVIL